jgi:hypothetical protein
LTIVDVVRVDVAPLFMVGLLVVMVAAIFDLVEISSDSTSQKSISNNLI